MFIVPVSDVNIVGSSLVDRLRSRVSETMQMTSPPKPSCCYDAITDYIIMITGPSSRY